MIYHYFNPENDLALGQGGEGYNPPRSAIALATDLSTLPIWFANPGEAVLTRKQVPNDWHADIFAQLGIFPEWSLFDERKNHLTMTDRLKPWGWNGSLLREWNKYAPCKMEVDVEKLRMLSHRRFAIETAEALRQQGLIPTTCELPIEGVDISRIRDFVERHSRVVLKSPWSCSGKGLRWCNGVWDANTEAWCTNILKRQGSLICEVAHRKMVDFAMEFLSGETGVEFAGYSLFSADESGTYRSNILLSNERIEERLGHYVDDSLFPQIYHSLESFFKRHIHPYYKGYFGVDMLIAESDQGYWLYPCVEVNLRMNMGVCARIITDRYIHPTSSGEYMIYANRSSEELKRMFDELACNHPLLIDEGKIVSGFLPLTYVDDATTYAAGAMIVGAF